MHEPEGSHRPHDVPVRLRHVETQILQCLRGQRHPERRELVLALAAETQCGQLRISATPMHERREVAVRGAMGPAVVQEHPGGGGEVDEIPCKGHRTRLPFREPRWKAAANFGIRKHGVPFKAEPGEQFRKLRLNPLNLRPVRVGGKHGHQQRFKNLVVVPGPAREPLFDGRQLPHLISPIPPFREPIFETGLDIVPKNALVHCGEPYVHSRLSLNAGGSFRQRIGEQDRFPGC